MTEKTATRRAPTLVEKVRDGLARSRSARDAGPGRGKKKLHGEVSFKSLVKRLDLDAATVRFASSARRLKRAFEERASTGRRRLRRGRVSGFASRSSSWARADHDGEGTLDVRALPQRQALAAQHGIEVRPNGAALGSRPLDVGLNDEAQRAAVAVADLAAHALAPHQPRVEPRAATPVAMSAPAQEQGGFPFFNGNSFVVLGSDVRGEPQDFASGRK
jgi:hypothetical protein